MKIPTPATRTARTVLGSLLIVGGMLGFLPILGFWMIPLGLVFLSHDFAVVRRFRRKWEIKIGRRWAKFRGNTPKK